MSEAENKIEAEADADDGGPYFRVYMFAAGRVLSVEDAADIQKVLADYNDELASQADLFQDARDATLRELGGEELVAAAAAADSAMSRTAIEKALQRYYERAKVRTDQQRCEDLAMLVRRLAYRHSKGLPLDELLTKAIEYLAREGLAGSPLRDEDPQPPEGREHG